MIEFVIENRRFRLIDGVMYSRAYNNKGEETKKEIWNKIKFYKNNKGYERCGITINGKLRMFLKHRLVKLAHDPTFDIFDASPSNCIDHENHTRDDNSNDNLRVVTNQQNHFNRSNVKGYYWREDRKKWESQITTDGKRKYLGQFKKEEDARAAYLKAKPKYHVIAVPPTPGPASLED
jgi:hypothetical protein